MCVVKMTFPPKRTSLGVRPLALRNFTLPHAPAPKWTTGSQTLRLNLMVSEVPRTFGGCKHEKGTKPGDCFPLNLTRLPQCSEKSARSKRLVLQLGPELVSDLSLKQTYVCFKGKPQTSVHNKVFYRFQGQTLCLSKLCCPIFRVPIYHNKVFRFLSGRAEEPFETLRAHPNAGLWACVAPPD